MATTLTRPSDLAKAARASAAVWRCSVFSALTMASISWEDIAGYMWEEIEIIKGDVIALGRGEHVKCRGGVAKERSDEVVVMFLRIYAK